MPPLSGIFQADFTSFTNACAAAEVSLKGFETGAGKTAIAVDKIADSLSGQKVVQQAMIATTAIEQIGGASKLTTDELLRMGGIAQQAVDKLTAIGEKVPPQIQNLADRARGASEELLRLNKSADDTGSTFSQWAGKFDIKSAIENPIGTAKAGVLAFAETLGPTGVAIGGLVGVVGALGGELVSLAHDADAVGSEIGKMARQFNIPVEAVSDLRFAIVATGGDFESFGNSMFMFQKRIEENGEAVGKGLDKIGLSLQTLQGLQGDQQILALSDAFRANATTVNLAAVAFELFGRQGRDMLPLLLKPLSDLAAESERLAEGWSTNDVNALRAFTAEMNKMKAETEEAWTSVGRSASGFTHDLDLVYQSTKLGAAQLTDMAINALPAAGAWFGRLTGLVGDLDVKTEAQAATQEVFNRLLDDAARAGKEDAAATEQAASKLLEMGYSLTNVATATGLSIEKLRELNGVVAAARTEAENYSAAWDRITQAETAGIPTLQGLSAETLAYASHLQDLHVKVTDITIATGLNAEQQKLLTKAHQETAAAATKALDELTKAHEATYKKIQEIETNHVKQQETNLLGLSKAENDASQKSLENWSKANASIEALNHQLTDDYNKQTLDRATYENLKLWESAEAQIAAFKKTGATAEQVTAYANKLYELTASKANELDATASRTLDSVTAKASSALSAIQMAIQQVDAGLAVDLTGNALAANGGKYTPLGMQAPINISTPIYATPVYGAERSQAPVISKFATGVENFGGGVALVGEQGPELVNLPGGSDVIPNGRLGGGGAVTVVINVTQPFGTPEAIARAVADAQIALMRGQGVRLPYGT